jgi:hypothetical protein
MDILEEEFKTEIIYMLLITLSSPIIGIKNYDEYYNHKNDYTIPVYKEIMVIKYGKIDSTNNLNNRIKQIKREYSAINVEILLLIKSEDLNIKSLAKLEIDFKHRINMNTDCRIILATQKDKCIYKIPNEFISVSFESLCEIKNFFISKYSKIVYDPYQLLNIYSLEDFNEFIINSHIITEPPLILDSNINNLSAKEIRCIKEYKICTDVYEYEDREDFEELLVNDDEEVDENDDEVWETDDEDYVDEEEVDEEEEENNDEEEVDEEEEENDDEDYVDEEEEEVDEEEEAHEKAEVIIHNEYMLLSLFILCFFVYFVINENIIGNDNNAFNKYSIFNDDTNIVTHTPFNKIYCQCILYDNYHLE